MSAVLVWRLLRKRYADEAFSGEGSRRFGARWSPAGINVVYCAESRSLATLEVLVNVRDPKLLYAQSWVLIPAELPAGAIERPAQVPASWRANPYSPATQHFGAEWVRSARSVALRIPSVVVPGEFNYLLNPAHPDFACVRIGKPVAFHFDSRLQR
ncbi:MAG: RES domain-containing protein [Verrucomicrobia bacterium]|nr:RES domain-containing protein [Verrucomicrobiota bacterium]